MATNYPVISASLNFINAVQITVNLGPSPETDRSVLIEEIRTFLEDQVEDTGSTFPKFTGIIETLRIGFPSEQIAKESIYVNYVYLDSGSNVRTKYSVENVKQSEIDLSDIPVSYDDIGDKYTCTLFVHTFKKALTSLDTDRTTTSFRISFELEGGFYDGPCFVRFKDIASITDVSKIKEFLNSEYPNFQLAYDDFADESLDFKAYPGVSISLENNALPPEPTCLYIDPSSIRQLQEDGMLSHVAAHVSIFDDTRGFIPSGGMARTVQAGNVVIDQLDVFSPDTFERVAGLDSNDFELTVFRNNQVRGWALVDGSFIASGSISSGSVFLNEIATNPGFYNLRWYPDSVGYWRIVLRYDSTDYIKEYEVLPKPNTSSSGGLIASFSP